MCLELKTATVYRNENPDSFQNNVEEKEDDIVIIKTILDKKETRQGCYCQVSLYEQSVRLGISLE